MTTHLFIWTVNKFGINKSFCYCSLCERVFFSFPEATCDCDDIGPKVWWCLALLIRVKCLSTCSLIKTERRHMGILVNAKNILCNSLILESGISSTMQNLPLCLCICDWQVTFGGRDSGRRRRESSVVWNCHDPECSWEREWKQHAFRARGHRQIPHQVFWHNYQEWGLPFYSFFLSFQVAHNMMPSMLLTLS